MSAFDDSIIALYFAAIIGFGIRYRHHTTVNDYFLGGKTFDWFPLCMSSMATQLSVVSFVPAPILIAAASG